ncbi:MAG: hypothetical protein SPI90_10910 [Fusobacterium mortiferum]|nr:hypothetical protein [Fusobacterium mortiferum]MDY5981816.1 hypothetical protein [Fusobacterium mortiferum]
MKIYNLINIVSILQKIERKDKLFELEIQKVYIWKLIRFRVMNRYLIKLNLINELHFQKKSKLEKIIKLIKEFILAIKQNTTKQFEVLFIDENYLKDKSKFFFKEMQKLKNEGKSYYIIEPNINEKNIRNKEYYSIYNFEYIILKIFYYFDSKLGLNAKEKSEIKNISRNFQNFYGKDFILDIKEVKKIISVFKFEKIFFRRFFKKKNIKKIYLTCSYGKEGIIAAARELGIKVIEFQHGIISKYHFGYNYPLDIYIPYLPDEIYIFSEYWKSKGIPKQCITKIYGYPYIWEEIKNNQKNIINKGQVLFISQGSIGKKLSKKVVEFAKINKDMKIIFRLHPGEVEIWKEKYKILFENYKKLNIEISFPKESLYSLLCSSEYVIGVYSTVIYEALNLKKKVGVFNYTGVEYLEDLIEKKYIYLFEENIALDKLDELELNYSSGYFLGIDI